MVNKSLNLVVRREAEEDIQESFQYYEVCSKGLGSDFILSVDAILSLIQRNPEIFPKIYKDSHFSSFYDKLSVRQIRCSEFPFYPVKPLEIIDSKTYITGWRKQRY